MFTDFIPGNGNAANVNITIMVTKYKYHSYIASIAVLLMTLRAYWKAGIREYEKEMDLFIC